MRLGRLIVPLMILIVFELVLAVVAVQVIQEDILIPLWQGIDQAMGVLK